MRRRRIAEAPYVAFSGTTHVGSGPLVEVALAAKRALENDRRAQVLVFDNATGRVVDLDYRGSADDLARRVASAPAAGDPRSVGEVARRGRGRPRLGVVSREVTLLPRHWEWLAEQPGGASVALRRLVDEARRTHAGRDRLRRAQDATLRFMTAMGGNEPGFEEATRALYAGRRERFRSCIAAWPADVRDHARALAQRAFEAQ